QALTHTTTHTTTYLELTPHPTLTPHIPTHTTDTTDTTDTTNTCITHTLHRDHDDHHTLTTALAHLHTHHHTITWPTTTPTHHQPHLPTYPFERHSYWLDSVPAGPSRAQTASPDTAAHPLLGGRIELADPRGQWFAQVLEARRPWFVEQHQLVGTAVLPAAAMLEWAVAGVRAASRGEAAAGVTLEGVSFNEFLHFGADAPVKVQALVEPDGDGYRVRCFGQPDEPADGGGSRTWAEHLTVSRATPLGTAGAVRPERRTVALDDLRKRMQTADITGLYERLHAIGVEYGPAFKGLKELLRDAAEDEALALVEVEAARGDGEDVYTLHPVVLDACFHVVAAFTEGEEVLRLPVGVDQVSVHGRLPSTVWCHARWHGVGSGGECSLDLDLLSASGEVLVTVTGLRFRTVSAEALRAMAVTRPRQYEVEWVPWSPPELSARPADSGGVWLVLAADPDGSGAWQGRLAPVGDEDGAKAADADADAVSDAALRIAPDSVPEGELERFFGDRLTRALESAGAGSDGSAPRLAGLLLDAVPDAPSGRREDGSHLTGTDATADPGLDALYRVARHSFLLLKHFLNAHAEHRPQVVVRSVGAAYVPAAPGAPVPAQSVLTGVAKAVISDYPDLKCVQVDVDADGPVPSPQEAWRCAESFAGSGHLAQRAGRWYEARLAERELSGGRQPVVVRPDATYVVTGGLGGIGLEVARWLALQGVRSLVLTGRRVPEDEGAVPPQVAALRAAGVRVELRRADVARRGDVAELLAFVRRELPPLRGVVHLAGVTDDAVLGRLDWSRVRRVLDPKVRGAWYLDRECAAEGRELDFFVLFSSLTSITGAAGQGAYVMANSVLDAFAAHRRRRGLAALSVGWGAWAEVGMAARDGALEGLAASGVDAMPPRQAFGAFARLAVDGAAPGGAAAGAALSGAGGSGHVGLARVDWHRYAAVVARSVPYTLLDSVRPDGGGGGVARGPAWSVDELAALAATEPERARELVLGELLGIVALLLGIGERQREELAPSFAGTRLNVLGLDSLTTVRLRSRLLSDYSADVPADVLFSGTGGDVAGFVCRQLALRSVLASDEDDAADSDETEVLTL
ncbi:type I polyketide synthase, partial [Streptomyces sp. NPDC058848]|uniref:type I polyketide synthase n=1 Tax=Streptomyces sp. NPDC058848 TaxID=3346650 RepID=UPI0036CD6FC3